MSRDSGTRSGMLWEVERILEECKSLGTLPQLLLMENVPQVIGLRCNAINDFQEWRAKLESLGYSNYVEILNAKDYGIPQNRERCFMVSILGEYNYTFPKPIKLEKKLKDLLEKDVDEKYFLSNKQIEDISHWNAYEKPLEHINDEIVGTLTTRSGAYAAGMKLTLDAKCTNGVVVKEQNLKERLCNSLIENNMVEEGDVIDHSYSNNRMEKMHISNQSNKDCFPTLKTRCDCLGVVIKDTENYIEWKEKGKLDSDCRTFKENKVVGTITTTPKSKVLQSNLRIRKLTGKECYRLMGFSDEDCENAKKVLSEAMIYHTAGDSIVVNVLMEIFKQMI